MKKFLVRCSIFGVFPVGLLVLILLLTDQRYRPAPMVTNSYCLNEKLLAFNKLDNDYLAIGSSITLNNLHSEEVVDQIGSPDFVNMAAWGMRMDDIFKLTSACYQVFQPKVVFLASNVDDFYVSKIEFQPEEVAGVLKGPFWPLVYARHLNPPYYYRRYFDNQVNKEHRNLYRSVYFDAFGGVPLETNGFETDSGRWNKITDFEGVNTQNYDYLDSLCRLVQDQQGSLVFLQSPIRSALLKKPGIAQQFSDHKNRVAAIVKRYGHEYIDGSDVAWPDSLFVDYGHLSEEGARAFTAYCLEKWQHKKVKLSAPQAVEGH
jgi:hypothetical protein